MATVTQAESPIFVTSLQKHRTSQRREWWVTALMAGLLVAMLAGLARPVDPHTLPVDERVPSILLD